MICSENVLVSCYLHVSALLLWRFSDASAAIVAVVPHKAGRAHIPDPLLRWQGDAMHPKNLRGERKSGTLSNERADL